MDPSCKDLKSLAEVKPTWSTLVELVEKVVTCNIAGAAFHHLRQNQETERDVVFENAQVKLHDFLLYVEFYHALTHGDIGRVEATLLDWAFMFKGVGKHKYATGLIETLAKLNFLYPERMRCILVIAFAP